MQVKFGLVALSVMATLVLFGGNTAEAKSESTEKKEETKKEKVEATVKAGDNLSAIAEKHKTSYIRLFNANKSIDDPNLIYAGDKIRIPDDDEKLKNRFSNLSDNEQVTAVASVSYQTSAPAQTGGMKRGSSSGNTYASGWCTWYAKEMRPDLPNNLGNGGEWVANARAQGIPTGTTPRAGAIAEQAGHVAYVESVKGNQVTVSEMGYNYTPGQVHKRTVPASTFSGYVY